MGVTLLSKLENFRGLQMVKKIIAAALLTTILIANAPQQSVLLPELPVKPIILDKPKFLEGKELECLLRNIYHEARGEPIEGQIAVAKVTRNRAANSSVCKAVYAPKQFSWTHQAVTTPKQYPLSVYYAAFASKTYNFAATHYHATYVNPKWSTKLTKLGQIGNHVFYH